MFNKGDLVECVLDYYCSVEMGKIYEVANATDNNVYVYKEGTKQLIDVNYGNSTFKLYKASKKNNMYLK